MRLACFLALLTGVVASAQSPAKSKSKQVPVETDWRRPLMSLPERPPANTTPRDIARFEENLVAAAPFFSTLTPNDYEANRELVRRMTVYLAGLDVVARDPQTRLAVSRARRAMDGLRIPWQLMAVDNGPAPVNNPPAPSRPPVEPGGPPFALRAPVIENLPPADKAVSAELRTRYESDAALAAAAWENTEVLRQNLATRGMTLNVQTTASVARLQLYFELVADALRERDWAEARTDLERAEYETDKILKTIGR